MKADAVFQGGGMKAIAFVGAVCYLEEHGYRWQKLAGTSAGSIIASFLAAGYKGTELLKLLEEINYKELTSKDKLQKIPFIGGKLGFFLEKGVFTSDGVGKFVYDKLKQKGIVKFKDISENGKSKLKIIASDITKMQMLILPDDLVQFDIDPMEFEIAKAVQMSSTLPFCFKPVKLQYGASSDLIVDGGLLSNFPIWIFDVKGVPRWPTLGFKFSEKDISQTAMGKNNIISFTMDIINTMLDRDELLYIRDCDLVRTVLVPSLGVKATDFNLTVEKRKKLFNSGYSAAREFINFWNFETYVETFRKSNSTKKII